MTDITDKEEKTTFFVLEERRGAGMSLAATALAFRFREHFGQKVTPYPKVTFKPYYDSFDKEQFLKEVQESHNESL